MGARGVVCGIEISDVADDVAAVSVFLAADTTDILDGSSVHKGVAVCVPLSFSRHCTVLLSHIAVVVRALGIGFDYPLRRRLGSAFSFLLIC